MTDRVKDLLARSKEAFNRRDRMKALYQNAQRLGCPQREGWDDPEPGKAVQREVYDSTFQDSVRRLANAWFVGMCPPWSTWIQLTAGQLVPEELGDEITRKLQHPTRTVSQLLFKSGFYAAAPTAFLDLCFGTCALAIEEDDETVASTTVVPIHELGIEEGRRQNIDATFRRHKVLARRLKESFPKAPELPRGLESLVTSAPDSMVTLLSCVVPDGAKWRQTVVWEGDASAIYEQEHFDNPIIVGRASVLGGEMWGRGPALSAMASAYSLNEVAKLLLIAHNMALYGMWTSSDDAVNPDTVAFGPGAIIPVARNDNANPSLRELVPSARLGDGHVIADRLSSQVQRTLDRDNLGGVEGPRMTATEIIERQALIAQGQGAMVGRINDEVLTMAVNRHISIAARRGRLPEGLKVDGDLVALSYISPLVRAQSMEQAQALRALVNDALTVAQADPSAMAKIDSGKYLDRVALLTGADMSVLRDAEQVQAITEQYAMAQAQLQGAGVQAPQGMPA